MLPFATQHGSLYSSSSVSVMFGGSRRSVSISIITRCVMNIANNTVTTDYSSSGAHQRAPAFVFAFRAISRWLDLLYSPFALATRLYVSWVFLHSGWLKISAWDQTLSLFEDEYHVPLLPPHVAAVVGSFGELFFPVLVIFGLAGRLGAVGLFAVNA